MYITSTIAISLMAVRRGPRVFPLPRLLHAFCGDLALSLPARALKAFLGHPASSLESARHPAENHLSLCGRGLSFASCHGALHKHNVSDALTKLVAVSGNRGRGGGMPSGGGRNGGVP